MFPNTALPQKQQGSMIVVALVVCVSLLTLGLALSRVITAQSKQNIIEYYGARSSLAARSGLERALNVINTSSSPSCSLVDGQSYTFATEALNNCTIVMACSSVENEDDVGIVGGKVSVFNMTATATCEVSDIQAVRQLSVEIRYEN